MNNLYEYNLKTNHRKLECDGLLFVEYQCMPGDILSTIWSQHNYLAFVQSGTKTWITPDIVIPVSTGDAIFCKKGAHFIKNYYHEQFCALIFFIPDDFIREVMREAQLTNKINGAMESVVKVTVDLGLRLFFESMMACFIQAHNPSIQLLKLKFKELILQLVTGGINPSLSDYFLLLACEEKTNLKQVMMDNYLYRLSQDEFAQLTNRSLSSFKRDFEQVFGTSFTKWINMMRLNYARTLLLNTKDRVSEIGFKSGFDTDSHFIRCFKKQFGLPPQHFRKLNTSVPL